MRAIWCPVARVNPFVLGAVRVASRAGADPSLALSFDTAEELEAEIAQDLSALVAAFRNGFADLVPTADFGLAFPTLPSSYQLADRIGDLREVLRELLLQERVAAIILLITAALLSLTLGLIQGTKQARNNNLELSGRERLFRKELTPEESAAYDSGGARWSFDRAGERLTEPTDEASQRAAMPSGRARTSAVNAGLWLELVLCILLDAAGDASLFYPVNGELADVGFAVFSAFVVELFFDWPALAVVALWEEALPLIDFIPTATIGWLLVVVLGLRPERRDAGGRGGEPLFRSSLDPDIEFAPGVRPPIADRRAYQAPEPWLRAGQRPWED